MQSSNSPSLPIVDEFVARAHAIVEEQETCISELLFETRLQVGDNGRSDWKTNIGPKESCGNIVLSLPEILDIRLNQFSDPNNATSGRVQLRDDKSVFLNIDITPGGAPLSVDCGGMVCELED